MDTIEFEIWDLHGIAFEAKSVSEGIECLITAYSEYPQEEVDYLVVVIRNAQGDNILVVPGRVYLHMLSTGKALEDIRALDVPAWFDRDDLQVLLELYDLHMENNVDTRISSNRRPSDTFEASGKLVRGALRALKRL